MPHIGGFRAHRQEQILRHTAKWIIRVFEHNQASVDFAFFAANFAPDRLIELVRLLCVNVAERCASEP